MLIEFKFRNFKSFKEESSFLMTTVMSFSEHIEKNIITVDREFNLLKTAAIYAIKMFCTIRCPGSHREYAGGEE